MEIKNKKILQAEATRAVLIRVAADLFAERGYSGASLDDIAAKAGLTKGALYHHFRDKKALFEAAVHRVLEEDLVRVQRESKERTSGSNSWSRLVLLVELFLDGFLDPRQRQIVWTDGPSVLGYERWHAVVSEPALDRIEGIIGVLADRGLVETRFRRPVALLLFGALQEAGLAISHAEDQEATREELGPAYLWILEKLILDPSRLP